MKEDKKSNQKAKEIVGNQESVAQTATAEVQEEKQPDKLIKKLPLFISSPDPRIYEKLEEFLKQTNLELSAGNPEVNLHDLYEVNVINPEIQARLNDNYVLKQLDEKNFQEIMDNRRDVAKRNKAKQSAITIQSILGIAMKLKDDRKVLEFTKEQLKGAVQVVQGKNLSHKQLDELLNYVSMYDFITPVDINQKSHLRVWKFCFTTQDHIDSTKKLIENVKLEAISIKSKQERLEGNLAMYEKMLEEENNQVEGEQLPPEEVVETKKKKSVKQPIQKVTKPARQNPKK